jgi:hypothetical protein
MAHREVFVEQPANSRMDRFPQMHADPASAPKHGGAAASTGTWMYAAVLFLAAIIFGVGIYLAIERQGWAMLAAGSVSIVGVLVAWPLAYVTSQARAAELRRQEQFATDVSERMQQLSVLLNLVSEQQLLSDRAKQVAFREKDRDALRRAIHEDLARKDWEAALALVSDMENTFGYKQEAADFRQEINRMSSAARSTTRSGRSTRSVARRSGARRFAKPSGS